MALVLKHLVDWARPKWPTLGPEATLRPARYGPSGKSKSSDFVVKSSTEPVAEQLVAVQAVRCLIFNEGYTASSGMSWCLCARKRSGQQRSLSELMPEDTESLGLLALMLLSKVPAHAQAVNGELITLKQDRSRSGFQSAIAEGLSSIEKAMSGRSARINCRLNG